MPVHTLRQRGYKTREVRIRLRGLNSFTPEEIIQTGRPSSQVHAAFADMEGSGEIYRKGNRFVLAA